MEDKSTEDVSMDIEEPEEDVGAGIQYQVYPPMPPPFSTVQSDFIPFTQAFSRAAGLPPDSGVLREYNVRTYQSPTIEPRSPPPPHPLDDDVPQQKPESLYIGFQQVRPADKRDGDIPDIPFDEFDRTSEQLLFILNDFLRKQGYDPKVIKDNPNYTTSVLHIQKKSRQLRLKVKSVFLYLQHLIEEARRTNNVRRMVALTDFHRNSAIYRPKFLIELEKISDIGGRWGAHRAAHDFGILVYIEAKLDEIRRKVYEHVAATEQLPIQTRPIPPQSYARFEWQRLQAANENLSKSRNCKNELTLQLTKYSTQMEGLELDDRIRERVNVDIQSSLRILAEQEPILKTIEQHIESVTEVLRMEFYGHNTNVQINVLFVEIERLLLQIENSINEIYDKASDIEEALNIGDTE